MCHTGAGRTHHSASCISRLLFLERFPDQRPPCAHAVIWPPALSCGWTRLFIGDPPAGYVACAIRGFLQVEGTHKCHGAAEANRYMESNVFLSVTDRDPQPLRRIPGRRPPVIPSEVRGEGEAYGPREWECQAHTPALSCLMPKALTLSLRPFI